MALARRAHSTGGGWRIVFELLGKGDDERVNRVVKIGPHPALMRTLPMLDPQLHNDVEDGADR